MAQSSGGIQIAEAPNTELQDVQYPFDGMWMPDVDPALIGPRNFAILTNLRYNDKSLEGVNGYTKVTSNPIVTYTYFTNGIQLRMDQPTYTSFVYGHFKDTVTGQGRVYINSTAIPSTGDFTTAGSIDKSGDAYHVDSSANLVGRFSLAPQSNVAYCNGQETYIGGGIDHRISAAFLQKDDTDTSVKEVTKEVKSKLTTEYVTLPDGTYDELIIMTTRPVQRFYFNVGTANASASTMTVSYWNGSAWAAVAAGSDGTSVGGITLAQSGAYTFTHTNGSVKLKHFQELYLFAYKVTISAGSATIYNITCNPAFQPIQNVWDGVYRQPIQFQVFSADHFEDYTLQVNESSDLNAPIGAILDGLVKDTDYWVVMFEEQVSGIRYTMLGDLINKALTTLDVYYWDGDSWEAVTNKKDGTLNAAGTVTLNQTGLISWTPSTTEQKQTLFGSLGYGYKFIPRGNTLSGTKADGTETVLVDLCTGIPHLKDVGAYDFPAMFKTRLMLCGYSSIGEGNRIDYSAPNAPDVFNGEQSSNNGVNSIYFGGDEPVRGAIQIFNRFGASIFSMFVVFKDTETYILTGDSPEDFQVFPVSTVVGCPAPLTIATTEVSIEGGEQYSRNFAVWLSHNGPLMFDGAIIAPIKGIENFFDPNKSEYINWDTAKSMARAWVDPSYKEYNLLIPTAGSTTANTWLVYDLQRRKWYRKDTGSAMMPMCGFNVMDPATGEQMIYGGLSDSHMIRLEYGSNWDGTGITQKVRTGDFWPSNNIWDYTLLRKFKIVAKKIASATTYNLGITYYGDTEVNPGQSMSWQDLDASAGIDFSFEDTVDFIWENAISTTVDLTLDVGLQRVVRKTVDLNYLAFAHAFELEVTTTDVQGGFQPIVWGVRYRVERKDDTAS